MSMYSGDEDRDCKIASGPIPDEIENDEEVEGDVDEIDEDDDLEDDATEDDEL